MNLKTFKRDCMKANNSFTINFITRQGKNEKSKSLLYAKVTVNGGRTEISLKENIDPELWDAAREEIKGNPFATKALNKHIEDFRFRLREKYRLLYQLTEAGWYYSINKR
jgi:hypothetical protein